MINISKYDVIVVKFPFASSLKYKARPAVVISSNEFNKNIRDTILIIAISSSVSNKLDFEKKILNWQTSGLLKESIFKGAIATIEKKFILEKVGTLNKIDSTNLENMLMHMC